MGKLSAKYQFCAIHTADNTDGKVTIAANCPPMSIVSEKVHRLDPPVSVTVTYTVATPNFPIGCNQLQSIATDRDAWCVSKFWS